VTQKIKSLSRGSMTCKWHNQDVNMEGSGAPEPLQMFAVGASAGGMFWKALVPGPAGVKRRTWWPHTGPSVSV
jgi:hypothetical protein